MASTTSGAVLVVAALSRYIIFLFSFLASSPAVAVRPDARKLIVKIQCKYITRPMFCQLDFRNIIG